MEAYIGLGSNIGDRRDYLQQALYLLRRLPEIQVKAISSAYLTEAITLDGTYEVPYLNAVCQIETTLLPHPLLRTLHLIENQLGRTRHFPWSPRTIDLDLLVHGESQCQSPELMLPHPNISRRIFVLKPLAEIAPHWRHPSSKKTAQEMLQGLEDFSGAGKVLSCCGSFS